MPSSMKNNTFNASNSNQFRCGHHSNDTMNCTILSLNSNSGQNHFFIAANMVYQNDDHLFVALSDQLGFNQRVSELRRVYVTPKLNSHCILFLVNIGFILIMA